MIFNKITAVGCLIGYFVVAPFFELISRGNLNGGLIYLAQGILGLELAIFLGIIFGWIERRVRR